MKLIDVIPEGSTAIAVMTDGRFLVFSRPTGSTGIWKIDPAHQPEKVVIYNRHEGRNRVYMGDYLATIPSHEEGRFILQFWNWKEVGETDLDWPEFSNGGANPIRYIDA